MPLDSFEAERQQLVATIRRLELKIAGAASCTKCGGKGGWHGYPHDESWHRCPACVNGVVFPVEEK